MRYSTDFFSLEVHPGDLFGVCDVLERIRLEHDEVGVLARCERSLFGETEEFGRIACGRCDHVVRGHSSLRHQLQFAKRRIGIEVIAGSSVVGSESNPDPGGLKLREGSLHAAVSVPRPLNSLR